MRMGVYRCLTVVGALLLLAASPVMAGGDKAGGDNAERLRLDQQAYGLLRFEWGQYAHLNDITVLRGDITCDGQEDRVLGWLDRDSPEGLFYNVMLATAAVGEEEAVVVLGDMAALSVSLPADRKAAAHMADLANKAEGEPLLCARGDLPEVALSLEPRLPDAEAAVLTGIEGTCGTAIRVDDGLCDSIRLFWLRRPADGERFVLHRR